VDCDHGCWLGSYEYEKQRAFEKTVQEGDIVFDVGANVGFYTLLASALVGPRGRVVVFEPLPRNLRYLRQHLTRNHVDNVTVVEAAVADRTADVRFEEGPSHAMGHISGKGLLQVQAVSLDEMVLAGKVPPPAVVKIDVEGAEGLVLKGALEMLSLYHPAIFLATHSEELRRECWEILGSIAYALEHVPGMGLEGNDEVIGKWQA
jgi:FkbM family methyltransferase